MKIIYSKSFQKEFRKQSGKIQQSIVNVLREVKEASSIEELTDCKKLVGFNQVYRLRIGSLRAFFLLRIEGDTVCFEYLVSRGEAYSKKIQEQLRKKDD